MKRSPNERHTWKLKLYVSTITDVFLNQKRINVCEHTAKMVPRGKIDILMFPILFN